MTDAQLPAPPAKKIRCLVIQLARLGDTLQSLMALRAAKQLYPQLELHVIVRERFSAAAKRVPWIDEVIAVPTDEWLEPIIKGQRTETQSLGDLARWLAPLVNEPWEYVVNWSFSEASSFLTSLVPSRVKLGYSRRPDLSHSCSDGWSHYMQAIVQGGVHQNIHLTDILTTQLLTALQIHVGEPADPGNASASSKGFFELELKADQAVLGWRELSRKWIAIQLGAGHSSKTWSPSAWAKTAAYLLNRHPDCGIVLLGGKEDETRAREFFATVKGTIKAPERIISMIGKTDFDLWASIVGKCQWLLAGDTAAIHLASILGTRVLNLSIGDVRWNETGPYGNGHYVISSNDQGAPLTPEAVYGTWAYASSEWSHKRQSDIGAHFSKLGWSKDLTRSQVLRSRIRNGLDGGGVVYESAVPRPIEMNEWLAQVMGHIARAWYCGWLPPIGQELKRETIHPRMVQDLRGLEEATEVLSKLCDEARRTAVSLHQRSLNLKSDRVMRIRDRDELRDLGKKLLEIDQLIERMAATQKPLAAFAQMSKVLMHNLRGEQLSELGRESADSYQQLSQGVTILKDWIKHTLEMAKPVALRVVPALTQEVVL